ncbi:MAG TPA: hypothetical protein VEH27_11310 [Methylomirabilota bacterium]|nr:hypothetical protein [Methylomirabilota bacterium]
MIETEVWAAKRKWVATIIALAGSVSAIDSFAAETVTSPWSRFITLRSGPGYKDNVTLASQNPDESAYWANGGDLFLLRTPKQGPQLSFFVSGEDVRYFSSAVESEQLGMASAEISQRIGEEWKASLTGIGAYSHGVFDASSTTTNRVVQVKAVSGTARPQIIRYFEHDLRLELRAGITRQYFDDPLDDYWEGGPRLLVGWQPRPNTDLTLSYDYNHRAYDTRSPLDPAGFSMPGGLRFEQHEVELQYTHTFDEAKKWRLISRALYERNVDNGSGYFDYHRYRASEALRFRSGAWKAEASVTLSHYDYDLQPAVVGNAETRRLTFYGGGLEGAFELNDNWSVYAEWEHERNVSNDPFYEYSLNQVAVGVELNF